MQTDIASAVMAPFPPIDSSAIQLVLYVHTFEKLHLCPSLTSCAQILHSLLWTPYFSWKYSHHRHHRNHASMENDEVYLPDTRSQLGIPHSPRRDVDWDEYFGDTPVYTLAKLIGRQCLAFPAYLCASIVLRCSSICRG